MSLKDYIRKRDFKKTAEPKGKVIASSQNRFVIQKHAASHLHYDFRLEMGGTLKSWAMPKGMPYAKGEKRLAVQVEDHPVGYIDFEGTIPQGEYGGGTVMVWDYGTFEPLSDAPLKELANGKLHFTLKGKKLNGEWYLVRLRNEKQWLMIKADKDAKPVSAKLEDSSAVSGRSMSQIGAGTEEKIRTSATSTKQATPARAKVPRASRQKFIEPMKAKLVDGAPEGDWIYEIKLDGFRALALKNENNVELISRNEKSFNEKFPEIVSAIAELDCKSAILDGEVVALDEKGRSSFQLLQAYELGEKRPPIFYYIFDLLALDGKNLQSKRLEERKAILQKLLKRHPKVIRFSASLEGDVQALLSKAQKLGLEGLIGKRADSVYEAGRRSGAWIKLKLHHEQELVIGGYSEPAGARKHFGALLLGYYKKNKLCYAGKVGTGFNSALLKTLYARFSKISQSNCPFSDLPESTAGRYGSGLTAGEMKRCHWLRPRLVCQIKFSEWTNDGKFRQPVFLGLREDKSAKEVVREVAK